MRALHGLARPLPRYVAAAVPARWADAGAGTALALLTLDRTGDAALAGLLIGALELPHALAAPFVGALADRSRAPWLFHAGALLAFAAALLGVTATLGRAPVGLPVGLALVAGGVGPLLTGGLSGLLGQLVPPGQMSRAYAIDAATYNVAGVAAPGAVAALGVAVSPGWATVGLTAVVAAGAVPLVTLPFTPSDAAPGTAPDAVPARLAGALAQVLRLVWGRPRLRASTVATTLSHVGVGGLTLAVTLLAGELGASHAAGGVLMSGYALGALAGSLAMRWPAAGRVDSLTVVLVGLPAHGALLALAAFAPAFPVAVGLVSAAGLVDGPLLAATLTVRGEETPAGLRTEVFTTTASMKITAAALGAAAAGGLAGLGGTALLLLVAASQPLSALAGWAVHARPAAPVGPAAHPPERRPADTPGTAHRTRDRRPWCGPRPNQTTTYISGDGIRRTAMHCWHPTLVV